MTISTNIKLLIRRIKNVYHLLGAIFWNVVYGYPGRELTMIGVTGTDGKTTTTFMIHHLLQQAGLRVALINTLCARIGDETIETGAHVTAQDPRDLQRLLRQAVKQGTTHVILEVTSHGLDQHRSWGVPFAVSAITNVKEDHLDYHGNYNNYLNAKAKLFRSLRKAPRTAILNGADRSFNLLKQLPCTSQIIYNALPFDASGAQTSLVSGSITKHDQNGMSFDLKYNDHTYSCFLPLIGTYNLDNAQAAFAAGLALQIKPEVLVEGFASMPQIPGRMQKIDVGQPFLALVDFAHTPAALEKALLSLRPITAGRLITLFGCAGERDQGRRKMGEVAGRFADISIFTREDNRGERVGDILAQLATFAIEAGATKVSSETLLHEEVATPVFALVPDRLAAIKLAFALANAGDTVHLTGKGHEPTLNVDGVETPWNEAQIAQELLVKTNS